jgi:glycosyltransferase involved in cell wall biosynthesis
VKTVVVIPWRGGVCELRDRNYKFVRDWVDKHHPDWEVYIGESDQEPFSPAQARNDGARQAGDWDVAIFWDADTLASPNAVRAAVMRASDSHQIVIAGDSYMYMDDLSSAHIVEDDLWFPHPAWFREFSPTNTNGIRREPCAGVLAVPRGLWDDLGGYLEYFGGEDMLEDAALLVLAEVLGHTHTWIPAMQLHLWHPPAKRTRAKGERVLLSLYTHAQRLGGGHKRVREYLERIAP